MDILPINDDKANERRSSTSSIATEDSGYSSVFRTLNSIRVYNSQHEYLIAMIEDLAAWLERNHSISIGVDNFFECLETGVILCRQAVMVQTAGENYFSQLSNSTSNRILPQKYSNCYLTLPANPPKFNNRKTTQRFIARDNTANFIQWIREFGFSECLMFETEDLISRKNIRNVILTLLELARVGGFFGLSVPNLVQMEQEIDAELEIDSLNQQNLEKDEVLENGNNSNDGDEDNNNVKNILNSTLTKSKPEKIKRIPRIRRNSSVTRSSCGNKTNSSNFLVNSSETTVPQCEIITPEKFNKNVIQSKPYAANCDIKSLDELVREILLECDCESVYPMTRLSEGKYLFGEKDMLIFVRVLRNHVMVRVGGGWDTLNNLLHKYDPCRKNKPQGTKQIAATSQKPSENGSQCGIDKIDSLTSQSNTAQNSIENGYCTLPRQKSLRITKSIPTPVTPCQPSFPETPSSCCSISKQEQQKFVANISKRLINIPSPDIQPNSTPQSCKRRHSIQYTPKTSNNQCKLLNLSPLVKGSKIPILQLTPNLNVIKETTPTGHSSRFASKYQKDEQKTNSAPCSRRQSPKRRIVKKTTKPWK